MDPTTMKPGDATPGQCRASRRRFMRQSGLALVSTLGALAVPAAHASGRVVLDRAASLPDELARALAAGRPLVVMASLDGCPFCVEARDSYLGPLRDEQQQPVVQVDLRSTRVVRGFDGAMTTHDALTRLWRISVTPTVLFFGPGGREIVPRMIGAYLPDYYGAYLEDRVRRARQLLKG